MGRLIEADNLKRHIIETYHDPIIVCNDDEVHFVAEIIDEYPTVEAIPKDQYVARLKADLVAMLTEIQMEIEEHEESIIGHYGKETKESDFPSHKIERNNGRKECVGLIQQKIDKLKEQTDGMEWQEKAL